MNKLPKDIILYLSDWLFIPDILSLSLISKHYLKILINNNIFWIQRLRRDFQISYLDIGDGDPKTFYNFFYRYEKHRSPNANSYYLICAVSSDFKDIVKYLLLHRSDGIDSIEEPLYVASSNNCSDSIDILINNFNYTIEDLNSGLIGAGRGGNIDLFDYIMKLGATNLSDGLFTTAYNNEIDLIKHIIRKYNITGHYIEKYVFMGAVEGGNLDLVKWCWEHYKQIITKHYIGYGIIEASANNHPHMLEYLKTLELL
jgi:hypothetical protein